MDADPFGVGGNPGALFLCDIVTGDVLPMVTDPAWKQPSDMIFGGGKFWVLDLGTGKVHEWPLQPFGVATTTEPFSHCELTNPIRWLITSDAKSLILDPYADPAEHGQPQGTIFDVAPVTLEVTTLTTNPLFQRPSGLFEDNNGGLFVVDADADPITHPMSGSWQPEGAIFKVEGQGLSTVASSPDWISPMHAVTIPEDGTPHAGTTVLVDANSGVLHGQALPTGQLYQLRMTDPWPISNPLAVCAEGVLKDPVDVIYEAPGKVLIADMNADPAGFGPDGLFPPLGFGGNGPGAIWRVDLNTGAIAPALTSPLFVSPTRMRWWA